LELAVALRQQVDRFLTVIGLLGHPTKGLWEPTQTGHLMGIDIDTATGNLFALAEKLEKLSKLWWYLRLTVL
jgi:hypothetical protein